MARIDRFIRPLIQTGAQRLTLTSGEKVTMTVGSQTRPMTAEAASAAQVEGFLSEILPPHLKSSIPGGSCQFPYASSDGDVLVKVSQGASGMQVILEPAVSGSTARHVTHQASGAPASEPAQGPVQVSTPRSSQPDLTDAPPIDRLFRKMIAEKCSDLHIASGNPPLFRKDGDIVPLGETEALSAEQARDLLLAITPEKNREQFDECHDTDFAYELAGQARFRCNLFMDRLGMGGVFRVIPSRIPSAEDLGLGKQILEMCHLSKGLILVTGPTGSGKSTTLAAMVDYINRNLNAHLITIEDPIEFVHQNKKCLVNQREVGNHTQGFKHALRAALREDPDIVLVGEMRDLETVAIAIETAETGHLVFGTLHTNTAPSTVDRIIDQFPTDRQAQVRTMLSESLKGVITQMLCKKKGGGRIAAQEVLIVNSAISNLIREGKTFQIPSLMQTGKGIGMVCLNDALHDLVRRDLVDAAEAYSKSASKSEFKALLARAGVKLDAAVAAAG